MKYSRPSAHPLLAFEDPSHEGNSSTYHTGNPCIERGCLEPAGTWWSPLWCFKHNVERMRRIDAQFKRLTLPSDWRWLRPAYKTRLHLFVTAPNVYRQQRTACGQTMFTYDLKASGKRCVECERHAARIAETMGFPNERQTELNARLVKKNGPSVT